MRAISHPITEQLSLPGVLHALSDPVRLEIVRELAEGAELACGALDAPVSKSTLSHHLKVLRDAGLTQTRAVGVHRFVSLRAEDVDARFPGLLGCVLEHVGDAGTQIGGRPV
jgi:DNA-binding transcriptional ArsR family regulator